MEKSWSVAKKLRKGQSVLAALLSIRGVKDEKDFLKPPNPLLYIKRFPLSFKKSLQEARKIIKNAVSKEVPIIIHGDYDADGICASAILFNFIKNELNYKNCFVFIPNRFEHGYGLTEGSINESLKLVSRDEKALFITVDSGITSVDAVDYLKKLGHRVVITDHHQKPDKLPKADAIVWSDKAVGASLAWVLVKVLGSKNSSSIGLAALATVTDVQPLIGFNRCVVKMGIAVLNTSPPLGLKKLLDYSGVYSDKEISTYELGWVVGPRINASGRLRDASDPLNLLTLTDEKSLEKIAKKLNKINIDRQEKTAEMFALTETTVVKNKKFIFTSSEKFHEGIIGLVAGRLVKEHYLPSIVIALVDGVGKGSVRSISGVDIISTLREFSELFIDLGGHALAAGFTIPVENIDKLEKNLRKYFAKNYSDPEIYVNKINVDLSIPMGLVGEGLLSDISKLKPFGEGNREPVFLSEKIGLADMRLVGKDSTHLSLRFSSKGVFFKGILFGGSDISKKFEAGENVDIVYSVRRSSYSGKAELILKDIKVSAG